jgi:hypothetical protein
VAEQTQAPRQRTDYWTGEDDRWHPDDRLEHQIDAWLADRFDELGNRASFRRAAVWLTVVLFSISCWVLAAAGAIRVLT